MALRDWIVARRPDEIEWRDAVLEQFDTSLDTDDLVERLKSYGEHSAEHLLGDLLNYWRRERLANTEPKFAQAASDFAMLYGDPDFIANLSFQGFEEVISKGAPAINAHFTWLEQPVSTIFNEKRNILFTGVGVERGYGYLPEIDLENRALTMRWRERHEEAGGLPSVLTFDDYVGPMEKPGVLFHLAEQIVHPDPADPPSRVSMALLARERPVSSEASVRRADSSATTSRARCDGSANSMRVTLRCRVRRDRARPTAARTLFTHSLSRGSVSASPR